MKLPNLNKLEDVALRFSAKLKRFIPPQKTKPSLGLDIGSSCIKLLQLQRQGEELKVTSFGLEPIKNNNREDALRNVLSSSNISAKHANISVSGQGVVLRYVQMPKMSREELKHSVSFELDKYIPFPADEVIIDCSIIKDLPNEGKMLALVAAAKKDLIEQKIALLEKAGLAPGVISVDSVVLANVFNLLCSEASLVQNALSGKACQTVAILDVGGVLSSLNILDRGMPLFTRDIFIGGDDITKRLMNQLGINHEAALKMKEVADGDWQKAFSACESVLSNLATEIRFSFDYFETENNLPISMLFVTGGGSYLQGMDSFLQQSLGIEVKPWYPISALQVGLEVSGGALKKHGNRLGVALGLALYKND